uniref:Tox-PL-2 domain-containing protein n=1 Tax=Cyanothece sp. (strain PCC 7425 / ATCC 29141) TaxID=395961 RepID=B8HQL1_CYAP4
MGSRGETPFVGFPHTPFFSTHLGLLYIKILMTNPEEVWQAIGELTVNYPVLQCYECAMAVMTYLRKKGIEGKILRLRTKHRELFITSNRYSPSESITDNGIHYGVEVFGKVFDNLSAKGLSREDWIRDFECRSGQDFNVEEL